MLEPESTGPSERAAPRSCVVLIVDDDEGIREMLKLALDVEGCESVAAANGEQGLALLRQHTPALVLLDLMMPVMDGWEFVRHKNADPALATIPVVVITAYSESAASIDAAHFLTKPIDWEKLSRIVHRHVD